MFDIPTLLIVLDLFELGLATGASTFALTFYFMAVKDGTIEKSERRLMGAVYFALRLAIVVILVTEVLYLLVYGLEAFPLAETMEILVFRWMLLGIIILNAILMDRHMMPMWLGPALAGGSWYALFFASVWPELTLPFSTLVLLYGIFVIFMVVLLRFIKLVYLRK